jgi:tetratricopeptide (TPR) repeat protein
MLDRLLSFASLRLLGWLMTGSFRMFFSRLVLAGTLIMLAPAQAAAAWTEARSRHFVVYSEQKPAELQRFAEQLERFDAAVRKLRRMHDPELTEAGKITIYVLRNQAAVAAMAGRPGSGIVGFYQTRASGAFAFVHRERASSPQDLSGQTVFFHEYPHHLMLNESSLALPAWFTEGSAELYATGKFQKDGSIQFGHPPQHRGYGLFNFSSLSTEDMLGARTAKLDQEQWEQIYGRGWLLMHYLVFGNKQRHGQLSAYIAGIQQGRPALDSARMAFGDLRQLDRELSEYLRRNRLSGVGLPASEIRIGVVTVRPLGAGESAALPVRMRSERGVNGKTAPRVAADAREVATRFPTDPEVLAALAEAEQDAGNNAAAITAADRALAVAPNHARALIMKSRALLALAEKAPAKTDWKGLRSVIGRANRLDPDDAEPLMLFYRSFLAQGVRPTANAVDGLLYAQALVPQDRELRMMAVGQMISDNKLAVARRLFGPIAYDPHLRKGREGVIKLMDALSANNAKFAGELLERASEEQDEEGS